MAVDYERDYHADADIEALDAYGTERGPIYRCRRCGDSWKIVGGGRVRLGPCRTGQEGRDDE